MTAKPVPEHISDERLAEMLSAETPLEMYVSDFRSLLTELQHRREAEAGTLPADTSIDRHAYRVAHIDPKLVRYVEMLRHECAYKGPCSDNGDGCSCSAEELNERHMSALAASPSSPASGVRVKAEPFCYVREWPASFDPQNGGEPASVDFSPVPKPGYEPLFKAAALGEHP